MKVGSNKTNNTAGNTQIGAGENSVMKAYDNLVEAEPSRHLSSLAEAALQLYGLSGADVNLVGSGNDVLFHINVPANSGKSYHPYLGRIDGKRFLLRVRSSDIEGEVSTYSEVAWFAELLRETDLNCPEPVPAWDGSLVVELAASDANEHKRHCVLFRCSDGDISQHLEMLTNQAL